MSQDDNCDGPAGENYGIYMGCPYKQGPVQNRLLLTLRLEGEREDGSLEKNYTLIKNLLDYFSLYTIGAIGSIKTIHFNRLAFQGFPADEISPRLEDWEFGDELPHPSGVPEMLTFLTVYDGSFEAYVRDFVDQLGFLFNFMFVFTHDAPKANQVAGPTDKQKEQILAALDKWIEKGIQTVTAPDAEKDFEIVKELMSVVLTNDEQYNVALDPEAFMAWLSGHNDIPALWYSAYPGKGLVKIQNYPQMVDHKQQQIDALAKALAEQTGADPDKVLRAFQPEPPTAPIITESSSVQNWLANNLPNFLLGIAVIMNPPGSAPILTGRVDTSDVQGLILRGPRYSNYRQFLLRVRDPEQTRSRLADLVSPKSGAPQLTTAELRSPGSSKPPYTLSMGMTYKGMEALKLSEEKVRSKFLGTFVKGAADPETAEKLGDTGSSAPRFWWRDEGGGTIKDDDIHLLLVLYAESENELEAQTTALRNHFEPSCQVLRQFTGNTLPDGKVHFGYRDGISNPLYLGVDYPNKKPDGGQTPVATGQGLIGYTGPFLTPYHPRGEGTEFSFNGSFAALRILPQDVDGFEDFIHRSAKEWPLQSAEQVAAKVMGRWRNGVPTELSPDTAHPSDPTIATSRINDFNYSTTDRQGMKCPVGSHIRRTNPRNSGLGGPAGTRRITRRGVPYGPEYSYPDDYNDQQERGLLGLFIGASLDEQFEHIMESWVQESTFNAQGRLQDPILGASNSDMFYIENPPDSGPSDKLLGDITRFVTTKGAAYFFLPGIKGLTSMLEMVEPDES